jgi:hypothetical protein
VSHQSFAFVVGHDGHGLLVVGDQTSSQGFRIIIGSPDEIFTGRLKYIETFNFIKKILANKLTKLVQYQVLISTVFNVRL